MTKIHLKKLTTEVINKDFANLRKPIILFINRNDLFMATIKLPFFFLLLVDKEVLKMNDKAVTGCLVHELCHMSKWSYKDDEREIDQMVIDKGYGWELYEFLKYHDNIYEKYNKKDGLTAKEVLKQLKSEV
jgi:hypothetical protein